VSGDESIKITDNRKLDPETGEPRKSHIVAGAAGSDGTSVVPDAPGDKVAELTADLQRLQAEYSNYRKRVARDQEVLRDQIVAKTLSELLPVLDDIGRARTHGELEGGFKSVGEALESTVTRIGLVAFGEPGDLFDPVRHEAIAHEYSAEVSTSTCVAVFQSGYEFGGKVIRPAFVSVADPLSAETASHDAPASDSDSSIGDGPQTD
jgi:molecular chaperone GrpE